MLSPVKGDLITLATREGTRQGGRLSHKFMEEIFEISNQQTKSLRVGYEILQRVAISECTFADDVVVMTQKEENMQAIRKCGRNFRTEWRKTK